MKTENDKYKLSIWERLTLPSPAFFKRVQAFALALMALTAGLLKLNVISEQIATIATTASSVMLLVSQFTVDINKAEEQNKL